MGGLFDIATPELSNKEKKRIWKQILRNMRADGAKRARSDYVSSTNGTFYGSDGSQSTAFGRGSSQVSTPSLGPKPKTKPMPDKPYEIRQVSYAVDYGTATTVSTAYGGWTVKKSGYVGNSVGTWNSFNSWDECYTEAGLADYSKAENWANQQIRKDAKGASVNLALIGAEGVQTAELMLNSIVRIHRVVKAVKNLDGKSLKQLVSVDPKLSKREKKFHRKVDKVLAKAEGKALSPKFYSEALLMLNWAWKPALNDVIETVDFLQGVPNQGWDVEYKRAGYERGRINKVSAGLRTHRHLVAFRFWKRVGYVAKYQSQNTLIQLAKEVGFTNPLTLIYEKVPASYLIDYFYPLGKWLDGIDAFMGLECVSVVKTERCFGEWKSSAGPITTYRQETYSGSYQGVKRINHFKRSIHASMPGQKLPSLRNPISNSATHSGNIIALVISNLSRML